MASKLLENRLDEQHPRAILIEAGRVKVIGQRDTPTRRHADTPTPRHADNLPRIDGKSGPLAPDLRPLGSFVGPSWHDMTYAPDLGN